MRIRKTNSSGFTLIELLIVIIIIGILAAIAFVAFSGARDKAKKADAQAVVAEARTKLAEYNAAEGYYPLNLTTFQTWLTGAEGGNNDDFSAKLTDLDDDGTADSFIGYTPGPVGCDNDPAVGGFCTEYTLTADDAYWSGDGTEDISVTN